MKLKHRFKRELGSQPLVQVTLKPLKGAEIVAVEVRTRLEIPLKVGPGTGDEGRGAWDRGPGTGDPPALPGEIRA